MMDEQLSSVEKKRKCCLFQGKSNSFGMYDDLVNGTVYADTEWRRPCLNSRQGHRAVFLDKILFLSSLRVTCIY